MDTPESSRVAALAVAALAVAAVVVAAASGGARTRAAAQTRAIAVAAGDDHTCALTTVGGVKCWGWNASNELGDGTDAYLRSTPVDVVGLERGVRTIAAGGIDSCAATTAGAVKCWGANYNGVLGNGTRDPSSTPVDVVGLSSGVRSIAVGTTHACAITSRRGLVCWGSNSAGQLGDGSESDRLTPVPVRGLASGVRAVSAGFEYTCALTASGGVKCWGGNVAGQLGTGSLFESTTPVWVAGLRSGVRAIAAGSFSACALTSRGAVKCWGGDRSVTPIPVAGLSRGVTAIGAGQFHTCAVVARRARCWGSNDYGQVGDGSSVVRTRPVSVNGLVGRVRAVTAGDDHTCALTTTGRVECWGRNDFGQLGEGTTYRSSRTPMGVVGFGSRLPGCVVPKVLGRPFGAARTIIARAACQLGRVRFGAAPS
jgi:alpha-tubulin suppressor-like RCC1 family protein